LAAASLSHSSTNSGSPWWASWARLAAGYARGSSLTGSQPLGYEAGERLRFARRAGIVAGHVHDGGPDQQ
jgi:hypothetical protein